MSPAGRPVHDSGSLVEILFDKEHRMGNGVGMAVDFEALDLVRSENKSRAYNKKLDELTQRNQSLQELVTEAVSELPEHRKIHFEEKLKKIKKSY